MKIVKRLGIGPCFLLLGAIAIAKPDRELPEVPKAVISAQNADQVIKTQELTRDVVRIAWVGQKRQIALLSWEKPVEVLDADTFRPAGLIADKQKPINFAITDDGNFAGWCENATKAQILDLRSGKGFAVETKNRQPSVAFSPDGKLFATGGYGTDAKVWKTSGGELVHTLEATQPIAGGLRVVFSPNGKLLAVGNRNSITGIYDTETGKLLHSLNKKMSHEIKFSPDSRVLAAVYVDGSIGLWDVKDGTLMRDCQTKAEELFALDWSPKGDVLATAGRNAKITLWDPGKLTVLKELESPEWVIQVRFSPDGRRLVTAGGPFMPRSDRKVTVWGLNK